MDIAQKIRENLLPVLKAEFDKETTAESKNKQYLFLLERIIEYSEDVAKAGYYNFKPRQEIEKEIRTIKDLVKEKTGGFEYQRYVTIFFNNKTKKIDSILTKFGSQMWRSKKPEDLIDYQKVKKYWPLIQLIIIDYYETNPK